MIFIFVCKNCLETYLPSHKAEESKFMNYFDQFCALIIILVALVWLSLSTFYILFPTFPIQFGYIFPASNCWTILCVCIHIYSVLLYFWHYAVILISAALYGAITLPLVSHELKCGQKSYASVATLREPANLIKVYRANQLFHIKFNICVGKILLPAQTMLTLLFIFSCYMLIRMKSSMELFQFCLFVVLAVIGSFGLGIFLIIFGYVHLNGNKVLNSWKRYTWSSKRERVLMNKFRVSCKPIMICWGKAFIVRKVSVLVFVRGLTRGLVRDLLSIKI